MVESTRVRSKRLSFSGKKTLSSFMQVNIASLRQSGKLRTSETYRATLNSFMKFMDGKDVLLSNMDAELMMGYETYLNEVTNNEFDVKFLRPITVKADKMDNFKDGVDVGAEGSVIDVKLAFTDWRNYAFVTTPINYYTYYGVKSITIDTDKAQTTVNGKYEPIPAGMKVEYSGVEDISAGKFGKLTYINNKAEVGEFDIKLPVAVEYAWGTVEFDIVCHVAKTVK